MSILYQVLATAIICYIFTTLGILYTLPSSTVKLFTSENTTLDRIMTETEISLMGSLSSASALIVTPFCGFLLDRMGRKRSLILFYLPQFLGWMLIVIWDRVYIFICSMFLCGLSGSLFLIVPVYVNEYCQESIRGSMTSSALVFYGIGMMISYLMGGYLDYATINYIGLTLSAIGMAMLCLMKESPMHLVAKGLDEEASKAIAFYRGCSSNSKKVIEEMKNLKRIINLDMETIGSMPEESKLNPEEKTIKKLSVCKYLAKSRSSRRSLIILLIALTTSLCQGIIVVQTFAEPLLEAAIPSVSPTFSSVLFAIVSVKAGLIGAYLIDTVGRRILLIGASIGTGFFCMVLGTLLYFDWGPSWLTVVFILLYGIGYIFGAGSVPFVLIGEVFLPEIRSFASMLCTEWAFLCSFIILFIFNPLFNILGLGPIFYFFGAFSFLTALICFIYIPETKGLQVDDIQRRFLNKQY